MQGMVKNTSPPKGTPAVPAPNKDSLRLDVSEGETKLAASKTVAIEKRKCFGRAPIIDSIIPDYDFI